MALNSVDVNYLIYLYLLESGALTCNGMRTVTQVSELSSGILIGYAHSAFIFGNESKAKDMSTSPGEFGKSALVGLLQRGVLYRELEARVAAKGSPVREMTSSELIRAKCQDDLLRLATAVPSPVQVTARRLTDHTGHISTQAWHPSRVTLATGSADASSLVYSVGKTVFDPQTCDLLQHAIPGNAGMSEVAEVCWSPDGEKIATATFDGHVRLWSRTGTVSALNILFRSNWCPSSNWVSMRSQNHTCACR